MFNVDLWSLKVIIISERDWHACLVLACSRFISISFSRLSRIARVSRPLLFLVWIYYSL